MSVLVGTITNKGRERQAESWIGTLAGYPYVSLKYFKIGEGGWISDGFNKIPKNPNPALLDIEADGSPGNTYVQKNITTDKVLKILPSTAQIDCTLELVEGNDNGYGESPQYFEIGLFDEYDNMIVYATFPGETKNDVKILRHYLLCVF